ncbi:MAG TPA: LLM class flavin-dependent oxidoreductase [Candidatus Limnocylindrales bacterium]|nr:LLM class flavin-dependent oxidoreductase [Candidatus Limnocylindrales bacterium]
MKFGTLLPHFGSHASASLILRGTSEAERLGLDSVWVRDHVVYRPHGFEDPDPTWLDPFVVLSALAAVTDRIALGTATLIPFRNPIVAAQLIASLATFADPSRLILAWGRGNDDREFEAVQTEVKRRGEMLEEQIAVIRRLLAGETVTHAGRYHAFADVSLRAPGIRGPIQQWYGGASERGIERTVHLFDGLLASRIPRAVLRRRIVRLRELAESQGRPRPTVGLITLVSIPQVGRASAAPRVDVERLMHDVSKFYPEHPIESPRDLDGVLIQGSAEEIADEVAAFGDIGVDHFIFDLRAHFGEWQRGVRFVTEEVVPLLRSMEETVEGGAA